MAKKGRNIAVSFALFRVAPVAFLGAAIALPGSSRPGPIDYQRQIQPIFRARCSPCHTGSQSAGGLSLESFEQLSAGGSSGSMTVGGRPESSELLRRILGQGGGPRMPMGFKALSDADTALIRQWIVEGAKNSAAPSQKHWAYIAPVKPPLPPLAGDGWTRNEIDRFVAARLAKEGLAPSPPADKTTLLRRVTLDLTGLPPTPAEVDAFWADTAPGAYERVVDRLLASPHYGERMALPWLDAARYADSNGFQQDGDNYQYVWRDWVVKAFNADKPFDQFTVEQLAGDLLPHATAEQILATAFNRNHMLNGEGGNIAEEQRNIILFDRVDATSTTWLGLTMACARCHDHKYDPLPQKDFYSLMAYFNNVPETGIPSGGGNYRTDEPTLIYGQPAEMKKLKSLRGAAEAVKQERENLIRSAEFQQGFRKWRNDVAACRDKAEKAGVEFLPWKSLGVFPADSFSTAYSSIYATKAWQEGEVRTDLVDGKTHLLDGENTAFYFGRDVVASAEADYLLVLGSDDGIQVWLNQEEVVARRTIGAVNPNDAPVRIRLKQGTNRLLLKIVNGAGAGGFFFLPVPGRLRPETAALLGQPKAQESSVLLDLYGREESAEYGRLTDGANLARAASEKFAQELPHVMVMSDDNPRETFVYNRGSYTEPVEKVSPAAPAVLGGMGGGNRLSLARWMVSPENPLTARVQVNRVWQTFFGEGFVKTSENFGVQGEPPSYPDLLDWLAVDYREHGWSTKRLVRQIVTSATYRQSSRMTEASRQRDPENRLLARGPRFRMPSLLIRDVALASSGLLDPKVGGPPVYPYQPTGIWDGLTITLERDFTYPQAKGSDNHRRSLYTFWRRTVAPGNMFDASSRQVCTVRPSLTSTPLHALTMLNDVTWVEAGRALAQRVMPLPNDDARLREAFRRVCARRPNPTELSVLKRALARSRQGFLNDPDAATAFLAQGVSPVDESIEKVELAAYASVCLAIYNLDEAMTKE